MNANLLGKVYTLRNTVGTFYYIQCNCVSRNVYTFPQVPYR